MLIDSSKNAVGNYKPAFNTHYTHFCGWKESSSLKEQAPFPTFLLLTSLKKSSATTTLRSKESYKVVDKGGSWHNIVGV